MEGHGHITWWGFSSSYNLAEKCQPLSEDSDSSAVNILIVGAGDPRHILRTISTVDLQRPINIYVLEHSLELYARHLVLLSVALEPTADAGLQERTWLFMDVFGNSLVRPSTAEYVRTKAKQLIRLVTDPMRTSASGAMIDLTLLKFKEIDALEAIFKFWSTATEESFNISKLWDWRIRRHLDRRYDSRNGVYDWDFHMVLADRADTNLHAKEYSSWRETGVAFTCPSYQPALPNYTMASGKMASQKGVRQVIRGYWGDIVTGPFAAYGTTDEPELRKKGNNCYILTATDVTFRNLETIFTQLVARGFTTKQLHSANTTNAQEDSRDKEGRCPVRILFLPLTSVSDLAVKTRFRSLFDVIYVSNSMTHLLTPQLTTAIRDGATVIAETAKYLLDVKKEQVKQFGEKITELATAAGCVLQEPFDPLTDDRACFTFTSTPLDS